MIRKIAVIGPESTGKSTLCGLLAQHFNTLWCPEFAREYLLRYGKQYEYADLLAMAKGQLAMEDDYVQKATGNYLFIDTDMYVMKVWSEYVFGRCHPFVLDEIARRKYDLYLLCDVDLPWVKDELREYPDEGPRKELYHIYKDLLINQPTPWVMISGTYEERLQKAVKAVEKI
jgi:NadR type nicotinamide-nucleotide adenylyltransferase